MKSRSRFEIKSSSADKIPKRYGRSTYLMASQYTLIPHLVPILRHLTASIPSTQLTYTRTTPQNTAYPTNLPTNQGFSLDSTSKTSRRKQALPHVSAPNIIGHQEIPGRRFKPPKFKAFPLEDLTPSNHRKPHLTGSYNASHHLPGSWRCR